MKHLHLLLLFAAATASAQQMSDTPEHSAFIQAVDEYVPAPGQWINILPAATAQDTPETMAQKCTQAIGGPINATAEDDVQNMISLGAWGGYVTFHFDHSIANIEGQRDLYIAGNALATFSEPGIVMVMKDENHNGLPDDTWYELSGSADVDSVGKVRYGYAATYTRNDMDDTPWLANDGDEGYIYRNAYHEDNEYFPLWLSSPLTLHGTRLPDNGFLAVKRPKTWAARPLRFGYVDNVVNDDEEGCSFDLSWAVDPVSREPVTVDFVDFVRVYSGVLQHIADVIGESSTEVQGARDLHLSESIDAITLSTGIVGTTAPQGRHIAQCHDLAGRRIQGTGRGLTIVRLSDGTTRKIIRR